MQKIRILLLEDEEDIAALIKLQGEISGFKVQVEVDGLNGFAAIQREKPDLVILDIMLPGQSGLDVCRKMKHNADLKDIPVILISAKSEELDVILGLELGADDYVTKPFSPKILYSRVKAVLRRNSEPQKEIKQLSFADFVMYLDSYQVKHQGKQIALTLSEFGILKRLVMNTGKVLTRNQLLDNLSNDDSFVVDRNIDVHIAALRKKLGPNFDFIDTVRGVGYRFKDLAE